MDLCHLKNSELEPQYQKYKGRVVLRGDIVKDDSGSKAVFTEQGQSASQMTAAKVYPLVPRSKWEMHRRFFFFKNSKVSMSRYLDTSTKAQMAQIMVQYGRPSRSSRKESERSSSGRTNWERQFEKVLLEHGLEEVSNWESLFVNRARGQFLSVYVDDIKLAGKTENMEPTWKILMKDVDLGEPSFLDHVHRVKSGMMLWQTPGFLLEPKKNYRPEIHGNLMQEQNLHSPTIWKVFGSYWET